MKASTWKSIQNDPEKLAVFREYQRTWRKAQRAKIKLESGIKPIVRKTEQEKKVTSREYRLRISKAARDLVYDHYGHSCVRCGEKDEVVLTIDHMDQRGHEHKNGNCKNRLSGYQLYRWLVKNNFPEGFRVACANCQIRYYREHLTNVG